VRLSSRGDHHVICPRVLDFDADLAGFRHLVYVAQSHAGGGNLLLFILMALLGWKVFGAPIHG